MLMNPAFANKMPKRAGPVGARAVQGGWGRMGTQQSQHAELLGALASDATKGNLSRMCHIPANCVLN